jgi:hypothetical protein
LASFEQVLLHSIGSSTLGWLSDERCERYYHFHRHRKQIQQVCLPMVVILMRLIVFVSASTQCASRGWLTWFHFLVV